MRRWRRDLRVAMLVIAAAGGSGMSTAWSQLMPIDATADVASLLGHPRPLQLAVSVNGVALPAAQSFVLTPPDELMAQRQTIEAIGIAVDGNAAPTALIDLRTLPGVAYRYDEARQTIDFHLPDGRRRQKIYDAQHRDPTGPAPTPDWGAFLNYSLFGGEQHFGKSGFQFSGANASLDARLFSPHGSLDQTFIVGDTLGSDRRALRLETSYAYLDQDRMLTGRVGDAVSSGLAWTRPIRFGGIQVQRDFTLQPDLVTRPLPSFAGTAAVPSTVDVFVNATKVLSERVDPGPYQLANIPSVANGTGNVVVTDSTGRQTQASLPMYNVASLLRPTLTDFSVEAGFARRDFGLQSEDYDLDPIASATYRHGFTPCLTVESHAEVGAGVIDAGAGLIAGTLLGTFEGALSFSHANGRIGGQLYAGYDVQLWGGVLIHASTQIRTMPYDDLAGATARLAGGTPTLGAGLDVGGAALLTDYKPPKRLSELSVSLPLTALGGSVNASFIDRQDATGLRARIISASFSHPLPFRASLFATVAWGISGHGGLGLLAGLNVPIGTDTSANIDASSGNGRNMSLTAQKSLGQEAGSYGWQVADFETSRPDRMASAAYRSGYGTASATVTQDSQGYGGTVNLEGSIATMGGDVALGNRIEDGFAIVNAGIPGVAVMQDNRRVGTTDPWGHFVASNLSTYQPNRIAIDPLTVPVRGETTSNENLVIPARSSGVRVDFGGEMDSHASTVVIVDAKGRPLPVGATGHLDGSSESFVIGYDGQTYIRHLKSNNEATIDTGAGACRVLFPYAPHGPAGRTLQSLSCS